MATDNVTQGRKLAGEPPPKTLDVRKYAESRAAELESLQPIVSNRLNGDLRSRRNKRRRTTGFDNKKRSRFRKDQDASKLNSNRQNNQEKKISRRVRRRLELKKNSQIGFTVSGDGTSRLRTHVWHAKRFTMGKLWGFYLPLGLHGRGRGSRALLKWYNQGVVVHDASYYSAVQLEGPEDSLLSILGMLLVPSPIDHSKEVSKLIIAGQIYGSAMLHCNGQDGSKAICPVTYMWRPPAHQDNGVGVVDKGVDEDTKMEPGSNFRRLWIWLHPSAYSEGFDCLKLACQKKMDETSVLVDCVCLGGQLGRLEVMGSKAFQLLQKILHSSTDTCAVQPSWSVLQPCTSSVSGLKGFSEPNISKGVDNIFKMPECLSANTVVSLRVVDPRALRVTRPTVVQEADLFSNLSDLPEEIKKEHSVGDLHMKQEEVAMLLSEYEDDSSLSNHKDLWDANEGVHPPMEESVLCLERHKKSLDFFCLKDTSAKPSHLSTETQFSRSCPILLLGNTDHTGALTGWSIILPLNWVKAFWIPLLSGGAHAIGLREKHWIACDAGLPYFPSDFPDCSAYSSFMAREATEVEKKMEHRTRDIIPLKVPIPPPWRSINCGFDNVTNEINISSKIQTGQDNSNDVLPAKNSVLDCEIFIARTPTMLTSFLNRLSGDHLLLFPMLESRKGFSHLMKDEDKVSQASKVTTLTSHGRRLCYLRVVLRAYKEGVFDEGAVVCAPRFSDLSLWTSRSDIGLQVPHASLSSYFKQLSSGEWEFQLPEEPAAREAYRQPIGFVTTGFVRGSKRTSAVGLCEAVAIAQLRQDQWSQMAVKQRRKDIFVLVRNLRSTAYRLALASIVVEQQQQDVKCF